MSGLQVYNWNVFMRRRNEDSLTLASQFVKHLDVELPFLHTPLNKQLLCLSVFERPDGEADQ